MAKSTRKPATRKPGKPHPDFPLFPHASGRWCKKLRGKFHYFGKVADDPNGQAALALWLAQKDDLLAGRTPRPKAEGLAIRDLCNRFLAAKEQLRDAGELASRTWLDYYSTCKLITTVFGPDRPVVDLASDDFERLRKTMTDAWGPVRVGNEVQRVRSIFRYGYEAGLLNQPVRFGPMFKRPSRKSMRRVRQEKGPKMFSAAECRAIFDAAGVQLKAMILLGLNCGFGNSDIGNLPLSAVDLSRGWVDFPRPKTAVPRRCPLWPETAAAIREAMAKRPTPKHDDHAGLMFVTQRGLSWSKEIPDSPVSKEFTKVLKALKLHRPGLGFYSLRHVFRTVADAARDRSATDAIMGHEPQDIGGAFYVEQIDDDRLRAVVDHVRNWIFGSEEKK